MRGIRSSVQAFRSGRFLFPMALWLLTAVTAMVPLGCSKPPAPTPTVTAAPSPTVPSPTPVPTPATLEVPITVRGASNLGSLQLELRFDPQVIELKGVKAGPLARNALVDSSQPAPGQVRIGLVASSGITGDGTVITLTFSPTGKAGTSSLVINQMEAADTNLRDLVVSASPGQFSGAGSQASGPVLSFRQ